MHWDAGFPLMNITTPWIHFIKTMSIGRSTSRGWELESGKAILNETLLCTNSMLFIRLDEQFLRALSNFFRAEAAHDALPESQSRVCTL